MFVSSYTGLRLVGIVGSYVLSIPQPEYFFVSANKVQLRIYQVYNYLCPGFLWHSELVFFVVVVSYSTESIAH